MRSCCRSSLPSPPSTASLSKKRHGEQLSWMTWSHSEPASFHIGGAIQTHGAIALTLRDKRRIAPACCCGKVLSTSFAPRVTRTSAGPRASQGSSLGSYAHDVVYDAVFVRATCREPASRKRGARLCEKDAS